METLKIKAWGNTEVPSSNLGMQLLHTEWDFAQFEELKDTQSKCILLRETQSKCIFLQELGLALQKTMDAAAALGAIEHTCDWDPILIIELKDGKKVETASHYYQVRYVDREIIEIEAPSPEDYECWKETPPAEYYTEKGVSELPVLVFKLEDIKNITIDSQ